jgi:fructokinase
MQFTLRNHKENPDSRPIRIAAIGELLWDLLPDGPRLGGAPANFASLCANLPQPENTQREVFLISQVGEDALGRRALEQMRAHRVRTEFVAVDSYHPTGTVAVRFDAVGEPEYEICDSVAWDFLVETAALLEFAPTLDAVCFGTLAQRSPVTRRTLHNFVQATRSECARIFDVNLRPPFWDRKTIEWGCAHATLVKVNRAEALMLAKIFGCAAADEIEAAEFLRRHFSLALVAVTRGADGCLLATEKEICEAPGSPVEMVDSIGAGDAFTAALTDAFLRGVPLVQIAETANFWGGWVASQPGGMPLPDRNAGDDGTLSTSLSRDH